MNKTGSVRILRITLLSGLMLLILAGAVLIVFFLAGRSGTKSMRQQDSFYRLLREYDDAAVENFGTEREFDFLNSTLDRLEKRAISVESWLSILKRRRALARVHQPSMANYRNSINSALTAYPYSQPVAAIASASLVRDSSINRETEEQLREWLSLISDSSFNMLRLGLHVIMGDFRSPERAAQLPAGIFSDGSEIITVDLAILKTLRGDYRGAAADIQMLINSPSSDAALRFAAEYNYDFGDLLRSAEIFSLLNDEAAMIRQADALYLAGFPDSARAIWSILASSPNENSLYNLAVTSEDSGEASEYLEKLVSMDTVSNSQSRQFGLIRYSRLLDYSQAAAVLKGTANLSPEDYPFIDLEICKRQAQGRDIGRQLAETWLLLDRHPENEDLYRWAAWHFFFQRRFDETEIFMNRMDLLQFTAQWVDFYRALQLMNGGNIDAAENILRSFPADEADWSVHANLGRILEAQRSTARAVEQYSIAAEESQNPKTSAKLQIRAARCLLALGRTSEARRALEYALDLDPENLAARLELDRISRSR